MVRSTVQLSYNDLSLCSTTITSNILRYQLIPNNIILLGKNILDNDTNYLDPFMTLQPSLSVHIKILSEVAYTDTPWRNTRLGRSIYNSKQSPLW